jgi:hypothetical protein
LGFYCVDDDKEVDRANPQIIRCVLCYNKPMYAFNPNTKETKGHNIFKTFGITTLKKYVNCDHAIIVNVFEEEVNKGPFERQPTKK